MKHNITIVASVRTKYLSMCKRNATWGNWWRRDLCLRGHLGIQSTRRRQRSSDMISRTEICLSRWKGATLATFISLSYCRTDDWRTLPSTLNRRFVRWGRHNSTQRRSGQGTTENPLRAEILRFYARGPGKYQVLQDQRYTEKIYVSWTWQLIRNAQQWHEDRNVKRSKCIEKKHKLPVDNQSMQTWKHRCASEERRTWISITLKEVRIRVKTEYFH